MLIMLNPIAFTDMHREDLQILVIGHTDRDDVDAVLWDPMPGGSGLLEQIRDNFSAVLDVAKNSLRHCPSLCEHSCTGSELAPDFFVDVLFPQESIVCSSILYRKKPGANVVLQEFQKLQSRKDNKFTSGTDWTNNNFLVVSHFGGRFFGSSERGGDQ